MAERTKPTEIIQVAVDSKRSSLFIKLDDASIFQIKFPLGHEIPQLQLPDQFTVDVFRSQMPLEQVIIKASEANRA